MNKILFILLALLYSFTALGEKRDFYLAQIPVLHEGRIKPFDTFARVKLREFRQKDSLKEMTASEWLLELLFDPGQAYKRKIFKINNPDVIKVLKLTPDEGHLYDFISVFSALGQIKDQIEKLSSRPKEELTPDQKQLITLHENVASFLNLSRTFSMFFPELILNEQKFTENFDLPTGQALSFFEIIKIEGRLKNFLKENVTHMMKLGRPVLMEASKVIKFLQVFEDDKFAQELKIIPPRIVLNTQHFSDLPWDAPWGINFEDFGDLASLDLWQDLYRSYHQKSPAFVDLTRTILNRNILSSQDYIKGDKLLWEVRYGQYQLFVVAFVFYLLSFLIFMAHTLTEKKQLKTLSTVLLIAGALAHLINLSIRCYLLGRPPVSNLYESIIFVGLIGVLFSLAMEKFRYRHGTLIGSVMGSILLLLSFGYERDGDSLGMLVAVLDTNFWLATHVIAISIGYGLALVTSLMAHMFLAKKAFQAEYKDPQFKKQIHYASLFSLFFVILGTMLGGVWADQSWGRFWGWDPKENGALLICLWLLWVIHGKIAGILKENFYMFLTALTSIIVVLAWFGVNLLSVGLHSYGFTENIAQNILLFVVLELLITMFFYYKIRRNSLTA